MKTFLLRRLIMMIPTLLGITMITFAVVRLGPNDPVLTSMQSMGMTAGETNREIIENYKKLHGLDRPIPEQYARWLGRIARLDFGVSLKDNRPVWDKIREAAPKTLLLSFFSIILSYLLAIPMGVYSAVKQNSMGDRASTLVLFILYSLPNFWVAMLMILFFCNREYFDWFPIRGLFSDNFQQLGPWERIKDVSWHLVLPVICLTYGSLAYLSRFQRSSLLEVIRQDYIRTARAKGLAERIVVYKHALRNALISIATLAGSILPTLFAGSVVVEKIFSIHGMGLLGFEAVSNVDLDVIMAVTLISAVMVMVGLLLTDILYVLIDPRISFDSGGGRG
ncbi:MAG: Inner membrane ABC transporter permease protein YejB [Myxococcota bacterium]|nr:Inner membrane ABC transporter permease protein YejB [Myxococcota bacterium]